MTLYVNISFGFGFFALTFVITDFAVLYFIFLFFFMELQISAKVFGLGLQTHCTFLSNNLDLSSHTSIFGLLEYFVMWPDHQLWISAPFMDLFGISEIWAQTKAYVQLCNYVSFIKRQTLVICSFSFFCKDNPQLLSDIYCTPTVSYSVYTSKLRCLKLLFFLTK